ncbi:MAG: ATP-binding cassette domain-containing protein [Rhodospirillaceae bacterium]|nr:ATP-binding cassette domain-containing protein [Rhodospirillaceae bacterium]
MAPLLILRDIHLTFGGHPLLSGADLSVSEGERLCLVGRNGSGKSTLLKIAAGLVQADSGDRDLKRGISIRYLPQEPDLTGFATTLAYVEAGLGPHDDPYRARYLLEQLGLTGAENPAHLSGGETRRAALARTLAPEPDVLLLDEPTNHLDLPLIEWLETTLKESRSAQVLISHDRRFLTNLSRTTIWLDRGQTRRLDQGFGAFEAWRDEVLEQEELAGHKIDRKIAREEDWVRYGVSGRRKRNQKRLADLQTLKRNRREERRSLGSVAMPETTTEMSAKLVVEAKGIAKSYGDRAIVTDFSLRVMRGDRIGIVGPNGAGKTTLLNLLNGSLAPDQGTVRQGANLETVTLDQSRDSLDPMTTLQDALTGGHGDHVSVNGASRHVVGYMRDFLFEPNQARVRVSVLSGGERGRLMLARALAKPSNVLVLDEPTNDLDLETLELLQETLADYPGTVLLVSHDRDFLDRVVDRLIAYDGPGKWTVYAGGYSDMIAQRGHGVEARTVEKAAPVKEAKESSKEPSRAPTKGKLSFKEAHALKTLPARIKALEAEIAMLKTKLAEPDLFARDPKKFAATASALEAAEASLSAAEDEWLAVEMRREELEG